MEPTQEFYMVWTDDYGFETAIWTDPSEAAKAGFKLSEMAAYKDCAVEVRQIVLAHSDGNSVAMLATPNVVSDRIGRIGNED